MAPSGTYLGLHGNIVNHNIPGQPFAEMVCGVSMLAHQSKEIPDSRDSRVLPVLTMPLCRPWPARLPACPANLPPRGRTRSPSMQVEKVNPTLTLTLAAPRRTLGGHRQFGSGVVPTRARLLKKGGGREKGQTKPKKERERKPPHEPSTWYSQVCRAAGEDDQDAISARVASYLL